MPPLSVLLGKLFLGLVAYTLNGDGSYTVKVVTVTLPLEISSDW